MTGFYEPTQDPYRFVGTPRCAGNWSPDHQHGGPPAALLWHTMERLPSSIAGPTQLGRFTAEILGPVPIGEVRVTASIARRGRSVELVEASLEAGGRTAMVARAWRLRVEHLDLPVSSGYAGPPLPELPPTADTFELDIWNTGYADSVEWRFVTGGEKGGSPVEVWARPKVDLVAGEPTSPLSRLLLLADTGNGISRVLDVDTWWFINSELTVHLHRQPAGEWFLLTASSTVESTGQGLTETGLADRTGRVGRASQALLVGRR